MFTQGCVHPQRDSSRPQLVSPSAVSLAKSQPVSNPLNQSTVNVIIHQELLDPLPVECAFLQSQVQTCGLFLQVTTLPSDARCDSSECSELSGLLQFPVRDRPSPWQGSLSLSCTIVHLQVLWMIESERELLRAHVISAWPVELCPPFVTLSSSCSVPSLRKLSLMGESLSQGLVG